MVATHAWLAGGLWTHGVVLLAHSRVGALLVSIPVIVIKVIQIVILCRNVNLLIIFIIFTSHKSALFLMETTSTWSALPCHLIRQLLLSWYLSSVH